MEGLSMGNINHIYKTHNETRNGRTVKVAGNTRNQAPGGNNDNSCRTAANDTMDIPVWEKVALTIDEAAAYSNIGITKLYELTNQPRCSFILHVGTRKRLIKRKEFEKYISQSIEI